MSITSSALPSIAFCKNPIVVELTSDDYIDTFADNAVIRMTFLSAIADGKTTRLLWANGDITLTARTVPGDSGFEYPAGDGSISHIEAVIESLRSNYYIDRAFTLALSGTNDAILFTAKKPGVLYNISPVADAQLEVTVDTPGVNQNTKPNFAHHLEVWITGDVDRKIYDENLQLEPGTGKTTKDISEILSPYFAPNVIAGTDKPDISAIGWQTCSNTIGSYYIKYAQYFGDTPQIKKAHTLAPVSVNYGGLDKRTLLHKSMVDYLRPDANDSLALCLRQGDRLIKIQADQPEFLYWLNLTGTDIDINLRIEIFYPGGGSLLINEFAHSCQAWQKYYVNVSYNIIAAYLPEGKQCAYYTVRVMSQEGLYLSTTYTYVLDRYRKWPRYFIYLNSMGAFQTLYTYGKGAAETDRTKEDIKKLVTATEAATSGAFYENNIRLQTKLTVYTGYTTERNILLLNDFLASEEKYFYKNGNLIPIGINTANLKRPADGDNLNGAALEVYPLYDDDVFTDDLSLPDTINDTADVYSNYNYLTNPERKFILTPDSKKLIV